eukprot:689916-Rhodomonas_salina.1
MEAGAGSDARCGPGSAITWAAERDNVGARPQRAESSPNRTGQVTSRSPKRTGETYSRPGHGIARAQGDTTERYVSTGHGIAGAYGGRVPGRAVHIEPLRHPVGPSHQTLTQYRALRSTRVAPYAGSVPHIAHHHSPPYAMSGTLR